MSILDLYYIYCIILADNPFHQSQETEMTLQSIRTRLDLLETTIGRIVRPIARWSMYLVLPSMILAIIPVRAVSWVGTGLFVIAFSLPVICLLPVFLVTTCILVIDMYEGFPAFARSLPVFPEYLVKCWKSRKETSDFWILYCLSFGVLGLVFCVGGMAFHFFRGGVPPIYVLVGAPILLISSIGVYSFAGPALRETFTRDK
ncbi:MAG: hypothetical protein JWL82_630 [Parcubacteria group bacterium]|nr:hypothetical protein [Parcubacteria group bacterium]